MKKILLTLFFIIPTLSFSQVITDGLVGHWPFNGNANDESGNGNHGVVSGAFLTEDRFGNINGAYEFDGVDDYIDFGTNVGVEGNNKMTLSVWINTNGSSAQQTIASQERAGVTYPQFYLTLPTSNSVTWGTSKSSGLSGWSSISTSTIVNNSEWCHLVGVYDGANLYVYVNGVQDLTIGVQTGNIWTDDLSRMYIGAGYHATQSFRNPFNGSIDDIRIFNRALNDEEIASIYLNEASALSCQTLYCDGENIGIGTSNTHGYRLAVAGDILAEKIKVATQANWPDYVFSPNYNIPSLEELEQYIQQNQKLPGIPSAAEAETEGIDLGEMNRLLLEKIEELTIYLIEQQRLIKELRKEIDDMKIENNN